MQINWQMHVLNLKIVYCGPSLSGKTTNLEQLHARFDQAHRSELVSLKTHEDRTLFFDFMQLQLGQIGGFTPKIQLYTVTGQGYYTSCRKVVLRGADGLVFVADSAPRRLRDNLQAWRELHGLLAELDRDTEQPRQARNRSRSQADAAAMATHGRPLAAADRPPIIVQFNKQDLPDALSPAVLKGFLSLNGQPTFEAIASRGVGVGETFKAMIRIVISLIQQEKA